MRKQLSLVLLAVSVWLVFAHVTAEAQAIRKMAVDVPFDFNIRNQPYPAGSYVVVRQGPFLHLRDHQGHELNVLNVNPFITPKVPRESKLVFFEYHGAHLLTQVIWQGDTTGLEFVRPGREEEVARQLVPSAVTSAQVGGK